MTNEVKSTPPVTGLSGDLEKNEMEHLDLLKVLPMYNTELRQFGCRLTGCAILIIGAHQSLYVYRHSTKAK